MLPRSLKRLVFRRATRGEPRSGASASAEAGRTPGTPSIAEPASYDGNLEEVSPLHAQGWIRNLCNPQHRVNYEIILFDTGEVLAAGCADQFGFGLAAAGIDDGAHAFWIRFDRPLLETERSRIVVRFANGQELVQGDQTKTTYEPLLHIAMDVVDNCNLRCPFCLYDYENTRTTHFMAAETLDAALRFLPYAKDGEFWFSCLHEPTLHPSLIDFIERVPARYRRKLFYTTNLAKRMPPHYFDWLASNGMHHINVSIESRDPTIYERMRKGARYRIFKENWDMLIAALDRTTSPTPIRYIAMAYKSNLRELPDLAKWLLQERRASQVEIRYTFDVPYIPAVFRSSEFLDDAEWAWLADELSGYGSEQVQLLRPPPVSTQDAPIVIRAAPASDDVLPGRAMFRLSWDGTLKIVGILAASRGDTAIEKTIRETNIRDIADPAAFFEDLARAGMQAGRHSAGTAS